MCAEVKLRILRSEFGAVQVRKREACVELCGRAGNTHTTCHRKDEKKKPRDCSP